MKRLLAASILLTAAFSLFENSAAAGRQHKNEQKIYPAPFVSSVNREIPRSVFVSYRSTKDAMRNDFDSSQNFVNLNGAWQYKAFKGVGSLPEGIATSTFEPAGWSSVTLPASYRSKEATLANSKLTPPNVPANTPVGVYTRNFTVPFDLADKALFLHIGAAKSSVRVYVNGKEEGYSQDSKNPAEFDITQSIQQGHNRIVVVTEGFSGGSYLENQAEWGTEGLNRDMFIFAQPKIRVRDYLVNTTLDPTYTNGLLETALLLKTQLLNPHTVTVYYDLFDPQGKLVNQNFRDINVGMRLEDTVRFTASIPNVTKWSAETPELYTILYRIKREGRFTEYLACQVGFRTVEVKDDKFLVNGIPVVIKGVNLSESTHEGGNHIDTVAMRTMLTKLKQKGLNAIRTDGEPMPYSFYQMCDQIGLYVCDVANIGTQWLGNSLTKGRTLSNDPAWRLPYLERIEAMYERNKNHPSVVMWSTGDRAGNGYNMYQAYRFIKAKDRNRPVVYEGAAKEWNSDIYMPTMPKNMTNDSDRPLIPSRVGYNAAYWSEGSEAQGAFLNKVTDVPDKVFANVIIEAVDATKGLYRFTNRMQHTDLEKFTVTYTVTKGRKVLSEGLLTVAAAPGASAEVLVPKGGFTNGNRVEIRVGNIAVATF